MDDQNQNNTQQNNINSNPVPEDQQNVVSSDNSMNQQMPTQGGVPS